MINDNMYNIYYILLFKMSCPQGLKLGLGDDAYKARIAIRIMSDTRDEEKDRNKDQGVLQDTQDPRTNCTI